MDDKGRLSRGPAKTADVNIRDIAEAAGVSVATVSRVMRGKDHVSQRTHDKVMAVVDELGYVPNAHAKALTTPPNSVALVVNGIYGSTYSEMTAGVERETSEHGMTFRLVSTGGDWSQPESVLDGLLSERPRVAVLTATDAIGSSIDTVLNGYVDKFTSAGISLVVLARSRNLLDPRIAVVDYANQDGMRDLTEYMVSMGHRRFAFAGKVPHSSVFMERYYGFRAALSECGLEYDEARDIPFVDDRAMMMANVMAAHRSGALDGVTAIVSITDAIALYTIAGLAKCGVTVPAGMSVGGFDDMPFAEDLVVPMTTVHVPFGMLGRTAVRLGLEGNGGDVVVPTELVIRGSVAPIQVG